MPDGVSEIRRLIANLAVRVPAGVNRALRDAGALHTRTMAQRFRPYGRGDPIQTRSGALRRSFGWAISGQGVQAELSIFSRGIRYASAQEYGATIRAKRSRYLTIPLPDALTPGGSVKGGARLVNRGSHWETADGARTFIFRSKRGALLVASRTATGRMRLIYALKPRVTLSPRLGFRETFQTITEPFLRAALEREAKAAVA